jgi:hypothetical protein
MHRTLISNNDKKIAHYQYSIGTGIHLNGGASVFPISLSHMHEDGIGFKARLERFRPQPHSPRNKKPETWTTREKQTSRPNATGQQYNISQDIYSIHDIKMFSTLFSPYLTTNKMTGRII